MNCFIINSTTAALLGAIIGGIIGVIGTIITTWANFKKESQSFKRSNTQKHIEEVLSAYSFTLNVVFNLKREGNPDRASYGDAYARISLYGSDEVKRLLNQIIELPGDKKREIDLDRII